MGLDLFSFQGFDYEAFFIEEFYTSQLSGLSDPCFLGKPILYHLNFSILPLDQIIIRCFNRVRPVEDRYLRTLDLFHHTRQENEVG